MRYHRPTSTTSLPKADRVSLLREYCAYYEEVFRKDPSALNRKLPREALQDLLDAIGCLLFQKSQELAKQPGAVREFLSQNPLPERLSKLLPDEFRAFCLALNALKQWVSAEQAATDRYLLGGNARGECRQAAKSCMVTGDALVPEQVELHHPVRDGRPPIPLSRKGHDLVEDQSSSLGDSTLKSKLNALKREGNRSWVQLRRGCLDLLGKNADHSTPKVAASSRTFARKASKLTGLNYEQLLSWLDESGL